MTKRLSSSVGNPATVIDLTVPINAAVLKVVLCERHSVKTVGTARGSKVFRGTGRTCPPEVQVTINNNERNTL
jgi:hypothetical protein